MDFWNWALRHDRLDIFILIHGRGAQLAPLMLYIGIMQSPYSKKEKEKRFYISNRRKSFKRHRGVEDPRIHRIISHHCSRNVNPCSRIKIRCNYTLYLTQPHSRTLLTSRVITLNGLSVLYALAWSHC